MLIPHGMHTHALQKGRGLVVPVVLCVLLHVCWLWALPVFNPSTRPVIQ